MALMLSLLWACSGTGAPGASELTPAVAAAIADEIAADPSGADRVLSAHGVDRSGFEAALLDIASDPAKTDAYLAARRR